MGNYYEKMKEKYSDETMEFLKLKKYIPMIKYGLISETDWQTIQKTIDLILHKNSQEYIYVTEIGLFNCETSSAIFDYIESKSWECVYTGIDNEKDKPIDAPFWMRFIKGNSNEVYNQINDGSQDLIIFDGDHTLIGVISDFFAYTDKVKVGGYIAFHDTGRHIKPFKDFQHGDKENPDAYISVRKSLDKIGLFQKRIELDENHGWDMMNQRSDWKLIFDEADENNEAGGVCVFKKVF